MTTADFAAVARDLPALVAPLEPLGQQWEPLGHLPVYQVLLRGPTKVEYLFLQQSQEAAPPVTPSPATLVAIDNHLWDWHRGALAFGSIAPAMPSDRGGA